MNQSEDLLPGDKVTEFDETLANVNYFLNVWLLMILSLVGVVANSLTIAVFRQQGWKEGVNISMMVISVLDLVRCLLTIFKRIHGFIEIVSPSDGVSWSNLTTPNAEFLNVLTNYVTFAMLAYVSLERCLCVTLPFTMRSVFNHKVTITTLTMVAASVYGMFIFLFLNFDLEAVFSANFNATIIILVHSRFYHTHSAIVDPYLNIMSMLHPTLCFIILCISSVVILKQLQKSRDTFSSNKKKDLDNFKLSSSIYCSPTPNIRVQSSTKAHNFKLYHQVWTQQPVVWNLEPQTRESSNRQITRDETLSCEA
ncbi:uncharacterized protein LOC106059410 [Biomphalaria glabrata]|uniref:Uncharacterized protein LOC106059410 n=1 Tax=Biomphalaria glabrata TaxID=6526 RepID=A0A9W3B7B4_BIOGL|nr:uncharacterized protein LOC106059410 [Biomphalaria glabrata]